MELNTSVGAAQLQGMEMVSDGTAGKVKVRVALAGQDVGGTVIVMGTPLCPAVSVPLAGLMVMPLMPVPDAVQSSVPAPPCPTPSVIVQVQPAL